jgi:hypothetical protein
MPEKPPKLPSPEEVIPGWTNGVVELLDPIELGWRLVKPLVEVDDGTRPL